MSKKLAQTRQDINALDIEVNQLLALSYKKEFELKEVSQKISSLEKDLESVRNLELSRDLVGKLAQSFHDALNILETQRFSIVLNVQNFNADQVEQIKLLTTTLKQVQGKLESLLPVNKQDFEPLKNVKEIIENVQSLTTGLISVIKNLDNIVKQIDTTFSKFDEGRRHYSKFNLEHTLKIAKDYYGQSRFADLERGLILLLAFMRKGSSKGFYDRQIFLRFLHRYVRLSALNFMLQLLFESSLIQNKDTRLNKKTDHQQLLDLVLKLYLDLAILEQRIQGNLPALEGIWIAKEQK